MLEEIQTAFGIGPRWDDVFLHDPGCEVHDECLFLKRVCTGKFWRELDQAELAEAFFTPGLYLAARGLAFIAPALMATALEYPQSDISGHAITSFSPKSDRTAAIQEWWHQLAETHDARQQLCIMNWLRLVNSRDEGLQELLPAGRLLALMRGTSKGFKRTLTDPQRRYSLLVEDDGRVAYAYLLDAGGGICADVWLYNRGEAPIEPEWRNRELAPFANPLGYVVPSPLFRLPVTGEEISVAWGAEGAAVVAVDGKVVARLADGQRPGFSLLALKDGPLAKAMT